MHEALNIRRWHNYFVAARDLSHILLANIGLLKQPDHAAMYDRLRAYIELLWDVPRKIRIVGSEHVSRDVPTVFASNHIKLDDPILLGYAIHVATDGRHSSYMMRSDFFGRKWYMKTRLLDLDVLAARLGAILVDRDNPRPGQLRPFIRLLCGCGAFVMFPTGTRTRTGKLRDYYGEETLGQVAFFLAAAGDKTGSRVEAVPCARTFNPVTRVSAIVFGEPLTLKEFAARSDGALDRKELHRAFNTHLIECIGRLVEVNVPHLLCSLLLRHAETEPTLSPSAATDAISELARDLRAGHGLRLDPDLDKDVAGAVRRCLSYLARLEAVRVRGDRIEIDRERLGVGGKDGESLKKINPILFLANQISDLDDVVAKVEAKARDLE